MRRCSVGWIDTTSSASSRNKNDPVLGKVPNKAYAGLEEKPRA